MKSNLIASIINCWYNTSLSLLPLLGKHLCKTASRHVKILWLCFNHRKKTHTVLQVKMYSNGFKNARYDQVPVHVIKHVENIL